MNRTHRVVWSESRQAFIVTSEKAKAKGKPSSSVKAVASAVVMALAAMAAEPAMAGAGSPCPAPVAGVVDVGAGVAVTSQCLLGAGESLTVANTGSISANPAVAVNGGNTATSIGNSGTLSGATWGIDIYASSSLGSITNNAGGSIAGGNFGIHIDTHSSVTGGITNSGTISGAAGGGIGVFSSLGAPLSSITGGITNNAGGAISGASYGIGLNNASLSGGIVNSGTITGWAAIRLANGGSVDSITNNAGGTIAGGPNGIRIYTNGMVTGGIINSGTIHGNTDGIRIFNSGSITGGITNSGTISGVYGFSLSTGGSIDNITNNNGGTITGTSLGIVIYTGGSIGSITNNTGGSISGSAAGITVYDTLGSISNSGTIFGGIQGVVLNNGIVTGGISNSGTISGVSKGIGLYNSSSVTGSITNNAGGTISGGTQGVGLSSSIVTGGITNNAGGTISSGRTGIYIHNSSFAGGISNNGTISGGNTAIMVSTGTSITGGITNNGTITGTAFTGISIFNGALGGVDSITNNGGGTISGAMTGIYLASGKVTGGITNSGTISGGTWAVTTIGMSTLPTIDIGGNNTASFVGAVNAPNTAVSILNGASYTLNTADAFTVASFTNNGTAMFAAGANSFDLTNVTGTTFTNNGVLSVADGGAATLTGNYTQSATGVLQVGASSAASYGTLNVTGTADLSASNAIDVNVAGANTLAAGNVLPGVLTAGTLTAGPAYTVTDNSALFDFTGATNVNAIDLTVVAAAVAPGGGTTAVSSVTAAGNTSALGAAAVFDALIALGGAAPPAMAPVITALGLLGTQQQVSAAIGQMLPLITGGMAQANLSNLHGVSRVIQARMEGARGLGLSSGDGMADRKAWVKPLGSWANQKDRNGAFGYAAQTYGVVVGADSELSQAYRMGAAFAYSHSNVDGNSGAQAAGIDSYQAVLYGSNSLSDATEINWQADYAYNQNKGSRYIALVGSVASSSYTSDSIHLGAGIGHTMALNEQTSFTPSFRADYTSLSDKGYTETGAGALNLTVAGKTTDEFILAADGKLAHRLDDNTAVTANLGVGYDANAKQNSVTASFAGGGAAFVTNGITPSSTVVRGGLGYVATTAGGVEITARYDLEARSGFTGQTASVKARWAF
ncbi:MAG: autotransporter domain-containing protein [Nitrosomonadales bacterium]|nr:autotransporter domain-containing protein [Nitrosomonadales bacterium]